MGHVDIKGELLILEPEDLVCAVVLHEVDARTNIRLRRLRDELERERVAGRRDTVSARIVGTLESAVVGTSYWIRAKSGVPCVPGVTVRVPAGCVELTPVRVKYNGPLKSRAAAASATLLYRKRGMGLGL